MSNENKYTYEDITLILKNYRIMARKALQLEFEIDNFTPVTEQDVIDTMTFGNNLENGIGSAHSNQSDKISNIAITYGDRLDNLIFKHKQELVNELLAVKKEMLRVDFYLSLLDEKYAKVLRLIYIDGLTYSEAAESLKLSMQTTKNHRMAGINALVSMYNDILK